MVLIRTFFLILILAFVTSCNSINPFENSESTLTENFGLYLLPPGQFAFTGSTSQSGEINFTWSNSERAMSYEVKYGTSSSNYTSVAICFLSPCRINSLTNGQTYYVKVFAINNLGVTPISNELVIRIDPGNLAPIANSQTVVSHFNQTKPIVLSGTDPENKNLTYQIISQPSYGSLGGSGSSLTYTPLADYYGQDLFKFKVNDGVNDSSVATVTINVIQPPTIYLSQSGNDQTGLINNSNRPFLSPQKAYETANTNQKNLSGVVLIKASAGHYSGIQLNEDWNSNIRLIGESESNTFLGGINGSGRNGAYYRNGISEKIPECTRFPDFSSYQSDDDCHVPPTRGRHINIFGSKIDLGDVVSNSGMNSDLLAYEQEFLERVQIKINSGLTAQNIFSNSHNIVVLPGIVEIMEGVIVKNIQVNSVGVGGMGYKSDEFKGDPIDGGTVKVYGQAQDIEARGRPNQIHGSGRGGEVTIYESGSAKTIDVRGGAFAFYGDYIGGLSYKCKTGEPNSELCNWSNKMGQGGTVDIYGEAGDIMAEGGEIPTREQSFKSSNFLAGAGGQVTIHEKGRVGNIMASASSTVNTNYKTWGASGGTVDVYGSAKNIYVNGTGAGSLEAESEDNYSCGGDKCRDPVSGGKGGHVILRKGSIVANIEANAGDTRPYFVNDRPDWSFYDQFGLRVEEILSGGKIEISASVEHGEIQNNGATDGQTTMDRGQIIYLE
jgi:hypothetical protein